MENVGGCPADELLHFLADVMPDRAWSLWKLEAADLGGICRFRVLFLGPCKDRLRVGYAHWVPYLQKMATPRQDFLASKHLLTGLSPEVLAEQHRLRGCSRHSRGKTARDAEAGLLRQGGFYFVVLSSR